MKLYDFQMLVLWKLQLPLASVHLLVNILSCHSLRELYEIAGPFSINIILKYSKGIVSSIQDFSASPIIVYCHAILITDYDLSSAIFYIQTK